jgi:hypothetical protein
MANFELKFLDAVEKDTFIKAEIEETIKGILININGYCGTAESHFTVWLDKSTAIKFAKTLRTEINKITESEVNNG